MSPRNRRTDPLRILGLARRAGALTLGTEAVRKGLREGVLGAVVLATDAAPAQAAKIERLLTHGAVPWRRFGTRVELGSAVGGPPYSAVGLARDGLAARFLEELDARANSREGNSQASEDDQTYAG